ncbi:hypothetical protein G6F59_018567 [Rhizopus arrhizus]|nr:hypothetical protein G6F59_018567 [Rhizopus arrhizus]
MPNTSVIASAGNASSIPITTPLIPALMTVIASILCSPWIGRQTLPAMTSLSTSLPSRMSNTQKSGTVSPCLPKSRRDEAPS